MALVLVRHTLHHIPHLPLFNQMPRFSFQSLCCPTCFSCRRAPHLCPLSIFLVLSYSSFVSPAIYPFFREPLANHPIRTSFSQAIVIVPVFSCGNHHDLQLYVHLCLTAASHTLMIKNVRVLDPSPRGDWHIGGAREACGEKLNVFVTFTCILGKCLKDVFHVSLSILFFF